MLQNDFKLITVDSLRSHTRIWRVLTLLQRVIGRSPSVLPFFLPSLVVFGDQLLSLFAAISSNPKTQGCRYSSSMETVILWASWRLLTRRSEEMTHFGLPPIPKIGDIEILYCLKLLLETLTTHYEQLRDQSLAFLSFAVRFFKVFSQFSSRTDVLAFALNLFTDMMEREEAFLSLQDVLLLCRSNRDLLLTQESVLYEKLVTAYWRFVFVICKRYVGLGERMERQRNRPATTAEEVQMRRMIEVMTFGGMTVVNPEVRKLFRPFFWEMLPSVLSKQFLRLLNEVGEGRGVECSRRRGHTCVSGCLCLTSCCCVRLTGARY